MRVLFNFDDDENDENNSSGNTFVSTTLLMVINMLADDLKMPVEYFSKATKSLNVDFFVNFNDEDGVYNKSAVEMIWPHYQNRYCLIYANTRLSAEDALNFSYIYLLSSMVWIMNCIFFYLLFRFR